MWNDLKHMVSGIDWNQLHFLRPQAFYLFIPLVLIVLLLSLGNRDRKKWRSMVHPTLRPFMFAKGNFWAFLIPLLFFTLGTTVTILGLAGPTWDKKRLPAQKIESVVLIAMDLSASMMAVDIEPSRLEREKFKVIDLLDANPRARAGLLAFAGTAHPVLPFTGDYKLIKHHAASLTNHIMPIQGTDYEMLFSTIDSLMRRVLAPSTVVLMTDEISSGEAAIVSSYATGHNHHIEILLFSSPAGAKIPGYPKVISKQDPAVIQNLAQDSSITITPLTLDKSDVQSIARRVSKKLIFQADEKKDENEWQDRGWQLIFPALLLTLFWFRRGWVIQWCWIPILSVLLGSCGLKTIHPDLWYSKEYQGQLLENADRFEEAADKFEDIQHKAAAYYKAGNYEAAEELFEMDSSAAGQYNRGLALAKMGRYEEALNSFHKAISLDTSLTARAETSIAQTKNAKIRSDSVLQFDARLLDKKINKLASDKKKQKEDPLKERKPKVEDEELSSDTRVDKLPTFGNRVTDETASSIHQGKESKKPDFTQALEKKRENSEQILLRQTGADPAEFLHKRFLLQLKRENRKIKKPENPW
jgi:Ca-activated chloride channel homolog